MSVFLDAVYGWTVWLSYITVFFFFNDTATTEIYTLSLHDALPIWRPSVPTRRRPHRQVRRKGAARSEEHTSELQSRSDLVCRLLLENKKEKLNMVGGRTKSEKNSGSRHHIDHD